MNHKGLIKIAALLLFCVFGNQSIFGQNDTIRFKVLGKCGMCEDRIEMEANLVRGVEIADWDWSTEILHVIVNPDKFVLERLHKRLAAVGHSTDLIEANEDAYENLPDCCRYKDGRPTLLDHTQIELEDNSPIFGSVVEEDDNGDDAPIFGANVFWLGTTEGTVSDQYGIFVLPRSDSSNQLVVSYVGFGSDTIQGPFQGDLKIRIENSVLMDEVEIVHRKKSIEISYLNALKVESISEKELLKSACCNLSESFDTNPTVDVGFTDAITGTRQISMLGLAGPYVQISRENIPDIRGLSALSGFSYTPGPWVESIQLNKGTGSVVNGFEGMTGQINVELRKPEEGERLYLNVYANQGSRLEANANMRHSLSEKVHTGLLLHGSTSQKSFDRNDDGFLDQPLRTNLIALHRWKFIFDNGLRLQLGLKGTLIDQVSGQVGYVRKGNDAEEKWGMYNETKRGEAWIKIGKVFEGKPYKSLGFQLSGTYHDQDSKFGKRRYDAMQNSKHANLVYQTIIGNTDHTIKTGMSMYADNFTERVGSESYYRSEFIPGAFGEYAYKYLDKFSIVAGLRLDHHNISGAFVTPRLHVRYAPNELTVLRASFGRGRRTASIFAENIGLFASSREIVLSGNSPIDYPYQLDPEVVHNGGFNLTQGFTIAGKSMVLGLDFYRTVFQNQIIVDYDENPQEVHFYNLDGKSYSNSIQVQVDIELIKKLNVRMAYRFNDVKTDYASGLLSKPYVSRNRAFINVGYETEGKWKFDITVNNQGKRRLPSTASNPLLYKRSDMSPSFVMLNAQVSKSFGEHFEIYFGGENLTDFRQANPIISSEDPFGAFFDASMIWGPIFGRNVYVGARYRIL